MAQWQIYIKWQGDKDFKPHNKRSWSGSNPRVYSVVPRIFNTKDDAQNYFDNKSFLKEYHKDGWIAEYKIQKVGK